ncbi:MAG: hypothetical protein AAF849_06320 [Bacteroidota bacterium]
MKNLFLSFVLISASLIFGINTLNAQSFEFATKNNTPYLISSDSEKSSHEFFGNKRTKSLTIPSGTSVILKTAETIHWENVTRGQTIQFMVEMDVVVDAQVVIRSNAIAFGKISNIIPATSTRSDAISIKVETVQAVTGEMIKLNGVQEVITNRLLGESIGIPSDRRVTGYVMNNTKLTFAKN